MELASNVFQRLKDLTLTNDELEDMTKSQAYNHFVRVYGDDKEMVAKGMERWNELNPSAKGRSAESSAEKD
jgi:hypothetical protein